MHTKLDRVIGISKLDLKGAGLRNLPALNGSALSWSLGPAHLLVTCAAGERDGLMEQVSSSPDVWVTDVTSVFAHFRVAGEHSREVLRKLTSLNISAGALPRLACGQTRVSQVHTIILRLGAESAPAFHILVSREYGQSVWDAILHAGEEFHLEVLSH